MIEIRRFYSFSSYLNEVKPFLETEEAVNSLALGILLKLDDSSWDSKFIFIIIFDRSVPKLAVQQMNHAMVVSGEPKYSVELAEYLVHQKLKVHNLVGPKNTVIALAYELEKYGQLTWEIKVDQGIYRLENLQPYSIPPGNFRQALVKDLDILAWFIYSFGVDIDEKDTRENARIKAQKLIKNGSLFVWENNEIVSMANIARPTKNGATVNSVYTSPEERGKGYATACVAEISKVILRTKSFCTLYTDLSNPTSNNIYKKIGYEFVSESAMIKLDYKS